MEENMTTSETRAPQEIVIVEIYVEWKGTLANDLHNRMVYVLSKTEPYTDDYIKEQVNSWLKNEDGTYTNADISSFERVMTDDPEANVMQSAKLSAGFVHVDMQSMQVFYYAAQTEDEEPDPMADFRKN
jgi:hypothetical protein